MSFEFWTVIRQRRGALLCLVAALALTLGAGVAVAAEESSKSSKKKKREKSYVLQPTTFQKMAKVWDLAQEDDFDGALEILDGLSKKRRLKPHDKAVVYQNIGMMRAGKEQYKESAAAFEVALEQEALPSATMLQIEFNLAQLYMALENFKRATELLEEWFKEAENPNASAYYLIAAAYAVQEEWIKALPYARQAVAKSKEPTERYLQLLLGVEFQNANLVESLELLKQLATYFPKKRYFMQLSYAYSNMGDEQSALGMMELAFAAEYLDKERELVTLAQRYYSRDLPFKAAEVLKYGLENDIIEKTSENYEFLSNSLLNAREYDGALQPMQEAANLSEDGDLYVRLAQIYMEIEAWDDARNALDNALKKGDLKDESNAHLLLGIINFNDKRFKSAKSSFQIALRDENTADNARQWLEHVDRKLESAAQ